MKAGAHVKAIEAVRGGVKPRCPGQTATRIPPSRVAARTCPWRVVNSEAAYVGGVIRLSRRHHRPARSQPRAFSGRLLGYWTVGGFRCPAAGPDLGLWASCSLWPGARLWRGRRS